MGLFDNFPYTNFHELNLDWILKVLKDIETTIDQFVSLNIIKYADPIQWDITRQYPKNTIVVDPISGTAYISADNVPQGVPLSNTDYWSVVFDLGRFITLASQNFANSYEAVLTTTATMPTAQGHWVVWNSILYEALNDIHVGDAYVVASDDDPSSGNIKKTTVEIFTDRIIAQIRQEILDRQAADTALSGRIDQEILDRQAADTTLGNDINTVANNLSTEHNDRITADNLLQGAINSEVTARQQLETMLVTAISTNNEGNRITFNAPYTVGTIIWWNGDLYRVNANVSASDNIAANVTETSIANELKNSYGALEFFRNKKVLVAGDSLSNEEVNPPNWVVSFRNELAKVNATVDNISFGGSSWSDGNNPNTGLAYKITHTNISDYDILIIESGTNDCTGQIAIGSWSTTSGYNTFIGAIWEVFNYITTNNADLKVYWCIPPKRDLPNSQYPTPIPLNVYRAAIQSMCRYFNWGMIDWNCGLPNLNPLNTNIKNAFIPDALHPSSAYAPIIADYTIKKIIAGGDTSIGNVLAQCEYTSFGAGATGILRLNYDTSGHVHAEFQLTLVNVSQPVKLFNISSDAAPLYMLPMLFTQGGLPCTFEYITDAFYLVPKTTITGDYLICQIDYSLDKLISRGVWSF